MKVTFKDSEKFVRFSQLRDGDTFIDPDYDEGTVLICVSASPDVVLGTDCEAEADYDGFAVDLDSGIILGYDNDTKVIPVEAEVVVQK